MRARRLRWWWYGVTRPTPKTAARPPARVKLVFFLIAASALLIVLCVVWTQNRMRPQVERLANARVHNLAAHAINLAVAESIARMEIMYDDLIHFEKDDAGRITALKTDMVMANRVKNNIHAETLEKITGLASTSVKIPLGNLTDVDVLAGRGPGIPIKIVPVGIVHVAFKNQFTSEGINQTRHQIMMEIETDIGVLIPGFSTSQLVSVQVCIAETIIVGAVPDAYAELNRNPVFGQ